ncbi:MAG: DUF4214 domain-containing protein [Deltaproteobacteria bacterium]|nr:DUF4214 domain-containing protein [Deltaproteobacteria bacterium]
MCSGGILWPGCRFAAFVAFILLSLTFQSHDAQAADKKSAKFQSQHAQSVSRLRAIKTKRRIGVKRDPFATFDPEKMEPLISCGSKKGSKKLSGTFTLIRKSRKARSKPVNLSAAGDGANIQKIRECGAPENCLDLVILGDGFTASDMPRFRQTVSEINQVLFQHSPFREYSSYFNVYRIDLESAESGVGCNPRNNALGTYLDCRSPGGPYVAVDQHRAYTAAKMVPAMDKYLVVANTTQGRANASLGGSYASTTMRLAAHTVVHELGHSIGELADEYIENATNTPYNGPEVRFPNLSKYKADEMTARNTKWAPWLSEPFHGTFEGAGSYNKGLYRATVSSVMRVLGSIFDAPGREYLIVNFYKFADRALHTPPQQLDYENPLDSNQNFTITTLSAPTNSRFAVQWYLDGTPIEGANGFSLNPESHISDIFGHELEAKVTDMSPWLREDYREKHATRSVKWYIGSRVEKPLMITRDFVPHLIIPPGQVLNLGVEVTGGAYEGIEYEWFKDGKSLQKSVPERRYYEAFYKENMTARDTGNYYVVVRSGSQEVRSTITYVEVRQPRSFTISTKVTDASGNGMGGVMIFGLPSQPDGQFPRTAPDGTYSLKVREAFYTIQVGLNGYEFLPESIDVDVINDVSLNFYVKGDAAQYTLSGKFTKADGTPLEGVSIDSSSTMGSAVSGPDGTFQFRGAAGLQYNLVPALTGYTFSPSSIAGIMQSDTSANFLAVPIPDPPVEQRFSISGRVTLSGSNTGVAGLTVFGGTGIGETTTNARGEFTFAGILAGTNYSIRVSGDGYTISPALRIGVVNSDVTVTFSAIRNIDNVLACYGSMVDYLYAQIADSPAGAARDTIASDLKNGATTPAELVDELLSSPQFVNSVPALRIYQMLGENSSRPPDVAGFNYYRDRLASGATIESIVKSTIESQEFRTKFGPLSNQAFVVLMYTNTLGRLPVLEELNYWMAALSGGQSREQVASKIGIFSEESISKQAFTIFSQALPILLIGENPSTPEVSLVSGLLRGSHISNLEAIDAYLYSESFPYRCGSMALGPISNADRDGSGSLSNAERYQWFTELSHTRGGATTPRWQNQVNRFDVNSDGSVSALDTLNIANELNRSGAHELPQSETPTLFYDVDGDRWITPADYEAVRAEIEQ